MKEFQAIVEAFEKSNKDGKTTTLATVIEVQGSTYRRAGARMLITQDGRMMGTISGGCLEADVLERAQEVMTSGQPILVTYDTTSDADIVWGLGLGCNGLIRVLIERLTHSCFANQITFLTDCLQSRQLGVIATIVRVEDQVQEQLGARLMLSENGNVSGHIEDSALAADILKDAKAAQRTHRSILKLYQLPLGTAEVFIEVIQPPVSLAIFGAGHDAIPVVHSPFA